MDISMLLASGDSATQDLSIFNTASPQAESIRSLAVLVFAITAFIFVVVEGILIYSVIRFRRRAAAGAPPHPTLSPQEGGQGDLPHPLPPEGGEGRVRGVEPPQVYGSKPIEIAWTTAPALVVFVLVLVTARTLWEVNVPPPQPKKDDKTLFVTVVGKQWWWEYQYDHYNGKPIRAVGADGKETDLPVITANELHVPAAPPKGPNETSEEYEKKYRVFLTLKSADVCHSFWVPRLNGKTDLIPGRVNATWFRTDKPGLYVGQCAEYCGTQHAKMLIRVVVDSPHDFEDWLENERKPAVEDPAVKGGREVFLSQSCVNCHRVRGTSAQGSYAPDLTHLKNRQTIASGIVPNTAENLRQWIADPQKIKPGCLMPAFGLSDQDRDLIVDYFETLH